MIHDQTSKLLLDEDFFDCRSQESKQGEPDNVQVQHFRQDINQDINQDMDSDDQVARAMQLDMETELEMEGERRSEDIEMEDAQDDHHQQQQQQHQQEEAQQEEEEPNPIRLPRRYNANDRPPGLAMQTWNETKLDCDAVKMIFTMTREFYSDDEGNLFRDPEKYETLFYEAIMKNEFFWKLFGAGATVEMPSPKFGIPQMKKAHSVSRNFDTIAKYVPEGFRQNEHYVCGGAVHVTIGLETVATDVVLDQYNANDYAPERLCNALRQLGYTSIQCRQKWRTLKLVIQVNSAMRKSIQLNHIFRAIGRACPKYFALTWMGMRWPVAQRNHQDHFPPEMTQRIRSHSPFHIMQSWLTTVRDHEHFQQKQCRAEITYMDIASTQPPVKYPVGWDCYCRTSHDIKVRIFPRASEQRCVIKRFPAPALPVYSQSDKDWDILVHQTSLLDNSLYIVITYLHSFYGT